MPDDDLDAVHRLHEEGQWDEATKVLNRIIDEEGPQEGEAWYWLGVTWEAKRDPEAAVDAYREAAGFDLGDLEPLAQISLARSLRKVGRSGEAIAILDDTDVDDDEELTELAAAVRKKAKRAGRVLRLRPGLHLTPAELAAALFAVLCGVSTALPWTQVSTASGAPGKSPYPGLVGTSLWSVTTLDGLLICAIGLVLAVYVTQMFNRPALTRWFAVVNVVLAVLAAVGILRLSLLLLKLDGAAQFLYPEATKPAIRPDLGLYAPGALTVVVLTIAVFALVRAFSGPVPTGRLATARAR